MFIEIAVSAKQVAANISKMSTYHLMDHGHDSIAKKDLQLRVHLPYILLEDTKHGGQERE
jgi:predicted PP-loop superfamily ATPase